MQEELPAEAAPLCTLQERDDRFIIDNKKSEDRR